VSKRLLDTNLIVRHLVQDHEAHAKIARNLFAASDRGEIGLVVLPEVVAEAVFVLESFYKNSRADIADILGRLLASPGIELVDAEIHQQALSHYGNGKLHFIDCVIAAYAQVQNVSVATFDKEFARLPNVKVEFEPT
jgi:predicted nucleic-acid-binding protein